MTDHTDRIKQIEAAMTGTLEGEFLKALDRGHNVISGNGIEARIKQMAQEAGFERFKDESVAPVNFEPSPDGMWLLWDDDALARFAQLVAEDCAKVCAAMLEGCHARTEYDAYSPDDAQTIGWVDALNESQKRIRARYSLKGE